MIEIDPVAKKTLGQHWLKDRASLEAICDAAEVKAGDQVLEIGPGTGLLTEVLLGLGAEVTALEFDQNLIEPLRRQFSQAKIKVIEGDIRHFDLTKLPVDYKVAANIPYYLTAYLLRLLAETANKPSITSLLVQKEVAERVAAKPGQMSFISIAIQYYYEVSSGHVVPAKLFIPPPKVDSQILILKRRAQPLFEVDTKQFFRLVKAGFSNRRKTLLNSLSAGLQLDRVKTEQTLLSAAISPTERAQELSHKDWQRLYISMH